jgi:A/G-specific adenine glycosylase
VKSKKLKVRNRYFNYLVVSDENDNTLIQKRTAKGIWQNLYEFPLIETNKEEEFEYVAEQVQQDYFIGNEVVSMQACNEKSIIHKLSHQHLYIKFWNVNLKGTVKNGISNEVLKTFPFPIVIHNFIEKE